MRNWIIFLNIINVKKEITQHYLDRCSGCYKINCWIFIFIFDTSTLHLPLVYVFSPISKTIHVSPLIIIIKKNKKISLIFNVGLNIFINSPSFIFTPTSLHYIVTFIHFNYLILKCSNNLPLILILNFLVKERLQGKDGLLCIMKVCSALNLHLVKQWS